MADSDESFRSAHDSYGSLILVPGSDTAQCALARSSRFDGLVRVREPVAAQLPRITGSPDFQKGTSMKISRGAVGVTALLIFAPLATACSGNADPGSGTEIIIGEIHPLTGGAAYYGVPMHNGAELAIKQLNANGGIKVGSETYKLKLQAEDAKGDPTTGVAAIKKLTNGGVKFVIGPLASGVASALVPVIQNTDTLLLVDGAVVDGITKSENIFRNQATVSDYDSGLKTLMKDQAFKSISVITDQFHSGYVASQANLLKAIAGFGTTIKSEQSFKLGDTSFSSQLTTIVLSDKPEAILVRGYATESALITRQAHEASFTGKIIWEVLAPAATVTKVVSADEMQGVMNAYPPTPEDYIAKGSQKASTLDKGYRAAYNEAPGDLTALSFDAINLLAAAFTKAGSTDVKEVTAALQSLEPSEVDLVNTYGDQEGGLIFDAEGQVSLPSAAHIWKDNGWLPLG